MESAPSSVAKFLSEISVKLLVFHETSQINFYLKDHKCLLDLANLAEKRLGTDKLADQTLIASIRTKYNPMARADTEISKFLKEIQPNQLFYYYIALVNHLDDSMVKDESAANVITEIEALSPSELNTFCRQFKIEIVDFSQKISEKMRRRIIDIGFENLKKFQKAKVFNKESFQNAKNLLLFLSEAIVIIIFHLTVLLMPDLIGWVCLDLQDG